MLFNPALHKRMPAIAWNPAVALDAIQRIAKDTQTQFNPARFWPAHPLDCDVIPTASYGFQSHYLGASGVLAGLGLLARKNIIFSELDIALQLQRIYRSWQEKRVDFDEYHAGLMIGEIGILLGVCLHNNDALLHDRLAECIRQNIYDPANEIFWAAPGASLAAKLMFEHTQDDRWKQLWLACAQQILQTWHEYPDLQCRIWTQDLYGEHRVLIGAGHGFAGNALTLLRGLEWLSDDKVKMIYATAIQTALQLVTKEGSLANWRTSAVISEKTPIQHQIQWCRGAAGIVHALARIPAGINSEFDNVLLAAGELIWQAGPLAKGSNLCHGTAGNGYAFLALYQRTGNALWLDRARHFAMWSIAQLDEEHIQHGQGRYSLWTGDIGLAIYLADCLRGKGEFPTLEVL